MQANIIARKFRNLDAHSSREIPMICSDMTIDGEGLSILLQDADLSEGDIVKIEVVFVKDLSDPTTH